MPTTQFLRNEDRAQPFHRDENGRLTTYKDDDSVVTYVIDWTGILGSDTISTSTWSVDSGSVTIASSSNTTTTTTVKVNYTDGVLKDTVVTAAGMTHIKRFAFVSQDS